MSSARAITHGHPTSDTSWADAAKSALLNGTWLLGSAVAMSSVLSMSCPPQERAWCMHPISAAVGATVLGCVGAYGRYLLRKSNANAMYEHILTLWQSEGFVAADLMPQAMAHEMGHLLMGYALYKNFLPATLSINRTGLFAIEGSVTSANLQVGLSPVAPSYSYMLLAAAGPAMSVLWNCGYLVLAQLLPSQYKEMKWNLRASAIVMTALTMKYALSAYDQAGNSRSHDFKILQAGGVSPVLSAAAIASTMVLTQVLLTRASRAINHRKTAAQSLAVSKAALFGQNRAASDVSHTKSNPEHDHSLVRQLA